MWHIDKQKVIRFVRAKQKLLANNSETHRSAGFTLIELLLYVALTALFLSGLIIFSWDVLYSRQKSVAQQSVEQSARFVMARIQYEANRSSDMTVVNPTELVFDTTTGTISLQLNDSALELDGVPLTNNQVVVTDFSVTDLSTSETNAVAIHLELETVQTSNKSYQADISVSATFELQGAFKESRSMLVDMTNLAVSGSNQITGIQFENTSQNPISLDQIELLWSNLGGSVQVTAIQINGGSEEWSGAQSSGSVIDINDLVVSPNNTVDLDYFSFNSSIAGGEFEVRYYLADGSQTRTEFTINQAASPSPSPSASVTPSPLVSPSPSPIVTPTPSPSPVPTPSPSPTSCVQVCQNSGFSGGTCRASNGACNANGETRVSTGNQYCTGGRNADTCCCAP